jgi:hypothetical protein
VEIFLKIREVLARRSDLSTFLVHLTRTTGGKSAKQRLADIVIGGAIQAVTPFGHAISRLQSGGLPLDSQKCVCFTETPLEHMSLLTEEIEGRQIKFEPYGIIITKKQARKLGVNPVWYLDITPGHDWLTRPVNALIERAISEKNMSDPVFRLTPFIEQFGVGAGNPKDFSWEREWRVKKAFPLPTKYMLLCPEADHLAFQKILQQAGASLSDVPMLDAAWGLETIIARLAGFKPEDVGPVVAN